ncbi:MAG: methionyl-tRNA formyltransferase [Candidatus Omnitrophota bacterium]|nr:MAG: methionyl-tRNA formyltransferase [Candidatus Omnitrophota bacterium]
MKIVFFGSSDFAVPSLRNLLDSPHEVLAVVTQPDRKKGRHLKVSQTPVKKLSSKRGITIYQPENAKDTESLKYLESLRADLFVVVAFGQIFSKSVLNIPKIYSINLHASLLPKYRGAAPVSRAIMNGENRTGLSIIRMNERMDAGDIILQRPVGIEEKDTSETLNRKLSDLGGILLLDAIRFIEQDRITFKKQDEKKATFAPKLKKEDGLIDWKKDALKIHNMVRGLTPWPCAFTFLNDKMLKIRKTDVSPSPDKSEPGEILDIQKEGLIVACGKGLLIIKELQLEGAKMMDIASFVRGHKIEKGMFLGRPACR